MFEFITSLGSAQLIVLIIAAILIGINKTAIPGLGVLPVVMLTMFFETRMSTGLQLGMLAMADVIAVCYYRRSADWKIVLRLLPWALVGLAVGSGLLRVIPSEGSAMKRVIGGVVLVLMVLGFIRQRLRPDQIPNGRGFAAFFGILMGTTTQLANAAGPISSIYLLSMKLPKDKYMGCCAWYFLILNWIKLPIFVMEGRITWDSFKLDLCMLPFIVIGGAAGIFMLRKIPQKYFEIVIQVLVIIAAVKLLVG